jgi:hypothetical protein
MCHLPKAGSNAPSQISEAFGLYGVASGFVRGGLLLRFPVGHLGFHTSAAWS